jgi:predicted ATPase
MRLYALSGRRSRALEDYEALRRLLADELGVEPAAETRRLYEEILDELLPEPAGTTGPDSGPEVPLVGRRDDLAWLRREWQQLRRDGGRGRLSLLCGEGGVGKSRLVKTFLNEVTSRTRATVLLGRAHELAPRTCYQPLAEVLHNAVTSEVDLVERVLEQMPRPLLARLRPLAPELAELAGERLPEEPALEAEPAALAAALVTFLHLASAVPGTTQPRPVVLFLDNLHWADAASLELLALLVTEIDRLPVWIIGACRSEGLPDIGLEGGQMGRHQVARLQASDVQQIAAALVSGAGAGRLGDFLAVKSGGLPLLVTEWINLLRDEGELERDNASHWRLRPGAALESFPELDLEQLVERRLERLPPSARRLLSLAACAGPTFAAELLQTAEEEQAEVVELALELLLERWLVRLHLPYWADSRQARDAALWTAGARRGTFELAHAALRRAIYQQISPRRRQLLHQRLAGAVAQHRWAHPDALCELEAHHFLEAGQPRQALAPLERAWRKASRLDPATAAHYRQAQQAAAEAAGGVGQGGDSIRA